MSEGMEEETEDVSVKAAVTIDFIAGTCGGIAQTIVGHPLDTLKIRLQTQPVGRGGMGLKYSGLWDCFRLTLREEKIFGLYKGLLSPLAGLAFLNAVLFSSYGFAKTHFESQKVEGEALSYKELMFCGIFASLPQCLIVCPMELVKTRLQNQYNVGPFSPPEYTGNIDCIRKTIRLKGFRGLYSGMYACVLREVPAYAVCFPAYEFLQRSLAKFQECEVESLGPFSLILAGGVAGICCWTVSYPQDIVLNRLRVQRIDRPPLYKVRWWDGGFWNCGRNLYQKEGIRGFTKGYSACVVRAFPANAASFCAYQLSKDLMERHFF